MRLSRAFALVIGTTCLTACLASGTGLVKKQAAFDFTCPEDQVNVVMISGMAENGVGASFGATGCGKKASYIRANAAGVLMNSPVETVAKP